LLGSVYDALTRLQEKGLITSALGEGHSRAGWPGQASFPRDAPGSQARARYAAIPGQALERAYRNSRGKRHETSTRATSC
jgi:hypothetical protein